VVKGGLGDNPRVPYFTHKPISSDLPCATQYDY
jgi:hypothetical protein